MRLNPLALVFLLGVVQCGDSAPVFTPKMIIESGGGGGAHAPADTVLYEDPTIQFSWDSPTEGTQAIFYVVVVDWEDDNFDQYINHVNETHTILEWHPRTHVRAKVAAVDSAGMQGPFSAWTDTLFTKGMAPGTPIGVHERRE